MAPSAVSRSIRLLDTPHPSQVTGEVPEVGDNKSRQWMEGEGKCRGNPPKKNGEIAIIRAIGCVTQDQNGSMLVRQGERHGPWGEGIPHNPQYMSSTKDRPHNSGNNHVGP